MLSSPKFADDKSKGRIILVLKGARNIGVNGEEIRVKAMKVIDCWNNTDIVAPHIIDRKSICR